MITWDETIRTYVVPTTTTSSTFTYSPYANEYIAWFDSDDNWRPKKAKATSAPQPDPSPCTEEELAAFLKGE